MLLFMSLKSPDFGRFRIMYNHIHITKLTNDPLPINDNFNLPPA